MDYYTLGQNIRKIRKAKGYSQEELAEKINISVTHMSHIETGRTKLSLSVFVELARALEVRTDELLTDGEASPEAVVPGDIAAILERCSPGESRIISDVVKSIKSAMDKYLG